LRGAFHLSIIGGLAGAVTIRYFPVTTALILGAWAVFLLIRKREVTAALILLPALLFGLWQTGDDTRGFFINNETSKPIYFRGETEGLPTKGKYGFIHKLRLRGRSLSPPPLLVLPEPLSPGNILEGPGELILKEGGKNPVTLTERIRLLIRPSAPLRLSEGSSLSSLPDRLRWKLLGMLQREFSPEALPLITAITIGYRDTEGKRLYALYARSGLAHLLSISGTHFGLLSLLVFALFRFPARYLPLRVLNFLARRLSLDEWTAIITFPVILLYLLLSGFRVPAVRSFIMIAFFTGAILSGGKGLWKSGLLLAATIIMLIDPRSAFTPSFQLSFLAVLSIGTALDFMKGREFFNSLSLVPRIGLKFTVVTISAMAGTLPLSLYYFHSLPVMGIPANMIVTPLVCFLILPLSLTGSFIGLLTGFFPFTGLIEGLVTITNSLVRLLSLIPTPGGLPFQMTGGALLLIYLSGWLFMARKMLPGLISAGLALSLILFSIYKNHEAPLTITFLDVGQGDSALIETSSGKAVGVDTGNTGKELIEYTRYRGKRLDLLILSHGGRDHAGGTYDIIRELLPREIWDNGLIQYRGMPSGIRIRHLKRGDILSDGKTEFRILHPSKEYYTRFGDDENNHSLVFRFSESGLSVLFTGDLESDGERSILRSGPDLHSTILKVGHHGSYTSTGRAFLKGVSPALAVISVGRGNPYGHPHKSALRRLRDTPLLRTDRDGAVRIRLHRNGQIELSRYRCWMLRRLEGLSLEAEMRNLRNLFLPW
jgi:competence protein ComEC